MSAHSLRGRLQYNKGVTIIELLVVLFILSLVAGALLAFQRNIFSTTRTLQTSLRNESAVRKIFKDFTAEIRSAAPAWNGAAIIETAGTSTLVFYANIDQDKYTERVRYQLVGTTLQKGIKKFNVATGAYDLAESVATIASGVTGTNLFTFYDKNYDGTASYTALASPVDIARVRLVRFDLALGQQGSGSVSSKTNSVQVTFRNLKDNY